MSGHVYGAHMVFEVYKLTFTTQGKAYIGASCQLKKRIWTHSRAGILPMAEGYTLEVLACSKDRRAALEVEALLMQEHGTLEPEGYNRRHGWKHLDSVRELMRVNSAGKGKGYRHSDGAKARMSAAQKSLRASELKPRAKPVFSAESLARIADAQRGRTSPLKGQKRSPETIEKMRQAHKTRVYGPRKTPMSDATKQKISKALQGKKRSVETRAKLSAIASERAHKGWQTRRAKGETDGKEEG